MASIINASTSTGLVTTADTSGVLQLQTGGTTALTVDASQNVTLANGTTIQGLTVGRGAGAVSTNTAVGASALAASSTGVYNSGFGFSALTSLTSGQGNSAFGRQALFSNTSGGSNSAYGSDALVLNTTGAANVAVGRDALQANTTASNNTAVGYQAGYTNTTGAQNTFVGRKAGYTAAGGYNTAIGDSAGYALTTGTANTFIGAGASNSAGADITTGSKNTIIGAYGGNQGGLDIRTASNYIVLSDGDGVPQFYIRNDGATFTSLGTAGPYNNTSGSAANTIVFSNGSVGRSTSSLKYKRNVQDATHGLSEVLTLRSVTYKGKGENDGDTVYGGLIAEEVHAAGLTEFVQYAEDGTPDALAYGNMVSLCINAIKELNAKVDAQAAEIAALKGTA